MISNAPQSSVKITIPVTWTVQTFDDHITRYEALQIGLMDLAKKILRNTNIPRSYMAMRESDLDWDYEATIPHIKDWRVTRDDGKRVRLRKYIGNDGMLTLKRINQKIKDSKIRSKGRP